VVEDFSKLKIALVSDELTRSGLQGECNIYNLTTYNYKFVINFWKPDFILVESAWSGYRNSWKYKIASYENTNRSNHQLKNLVEYAKQKNIKTVFWNKEDGIHFDRFINSAKFFDYIFTTDENKINDYKLNCPNAKSVNSLTFAVNTKIHYPQNLQRKNKFVFCGSFRADLHQERRKNQLMLLSAAKEFGLDIYDRNSDRKSSIFRFPEEFKKNILPKISYEKTGNIYNSYLGCLNINTILDSKTMFSRRLIEIMACKSPVVTTPSLAIDNFFKDFVFIANTKEEAKEHFLRLKSGYNKEIIQKLDGGFNLINQLFTYKNWLQAILKSIN
jgi:hypothetical protein